MTKCQSLQYREVVRWILSTFYHSTDLFSPASNMLIPQLYDSLDGHTAQLFSMIDMRAGSPVCRAVLLPILGNGGRRQKEGHSKAATSS